MQSTIGEALYGERPYTPPVAWACWLHVVNGMFWHEEGGRLLIRSPDGVDQHKLAIVAAASAAIAAETEAADEDPSDADAPAGSKRVRLRVTKESKMRLQKVSSIPPPPQAAPSPLRRGCELPRPRSLQIFQVGCRRRSCTAAVCAAPITKRSESPRFASGGGGGSALPRLAVPPPRATR